MTAVRGTQGQIPGQPGADQRNGTDHLSDPAMLVQ
jgi:hypothetical protein